MIPTALSAQRYRQSILHQQQKYWQAVGQALAEAVPCMSESHADSHEGAIFSSLSLQELLLVLTTLSIFEMN